MQFSWRAYNCKKKKAGSACKHAQGVPCSLLICDIEYSCKFFYDIDYLVQSWMQFTFRAYNCNKKPAGTVSKLAQWGPAAS